MGIELVIFKVTHSGQVGVQSEALLTVVQSFALNSSADFSHGKTK
jgi:hypothetical protein